jgi:hypothetical protein
MEVICTALTNEKDSWHLACLLIQAIFFITIIIQSDAKGDQDDEIKRTTTG